MTGGPGFAAAASSALLETLPLAAALTLFMAVALHLLKGLTPSARHTLWLLTLLTVAALPLARILLAPVRSPSTPPATQRFLDAGPAAADRTSGACTANAGAGAAGPNRRRAGWVARSGSFLLPSVPATATDAAATLGRLWLGIAFVLLLRAGFSLRTLLRMKAEGDLLSPPVQEWAASLLRLRSSRRRASVKSHADLAVPVTAGLRAPVVLVPPAMARYLPEAHLRKIVLHEAAHVLRWDDWTHLFEHLLRSLFFFHPIVWWIARRMQLEREMACDDLVIEATGDARGYARCLVTVAELAGRHRVRYPAPAVSRHPSQLARRITMIVNRQKPFPRAVRALMLTAAAAFLALALAPCVLSPREALAAVPSGSLDLLAPVIGVLPDARMTTQDVPPSAAPPAPPAPPPAPVPPAPGTAPKALKPPAQIPAPAPPKPVESLNALEPLEPPEPVEPIEPIEPIEPDDWDHAVDIEAIEAEVEKALKEADLERLDEDEIERRVEQAMKKAEKGMGDARSQLQRAEKQLLAEQARLMAARDELDGTAKVISEAEMDALEARIESLGEAIEQKVEARLEGINWEKLNKAEARELARERLRGLDEEIRELSDQIKALSGQLAAQARLRALPEIEEALKEIRQAQKDLSLERENATDR